MLADLCISDAVHSYKIMQYLN